MIKDVAPNLVYGDVFRDKYAKIRFKMYYDLLSSFIRNNTRLLDVGCYTADMVNLMPSTVDYYGIDSDEAALEIAKHRGAEVIKLDLEHEEIPLREKFDIVVATEVLEHLKDPEKAILQIKKMVKNDGVVLISLPNECTLYHRLKVLLGKGINGTGFAPHYHLHFPTVEQDNEFVGRHFTIVQKRYWVHTGVGGKAEKVLSKIPIRFLTMLAKICPSLFARGIIFLCKPKQ